MVNDPGLAHKIFNAVKANNNIAIMPLLDMFSDVLPEASYTLKRLEEKKVLEVDNGVVRILHKQPIQ